jgi:alpha-ketoglutarate-dependent taurine dioxygenase
MSDVRVRPLHESVGAEIEGFDPSEPLTDEVLAPLREAFDDYSVLVFRDLDIDEKGQRALVFGLIHEDPAAYDDLSTRKTLRVSNRTEDSAAPYGRLLFHCDNMWARTPQFALSLYGERVEPPSAPTQFVSMVDGWETLSDDLKGRVAQLEARHGFDGGYPNRGGDDDVTDVDFGASRSVVRPVAWQHPRTGKTLLYASQQATIEVLGLPADENEALLAELFAHLYRPSAVMQHDWREGDLVIWDNVAVQHARGPVDLEGPERTLRKVFGPMHLDPDEVLMPTYSKVADRPSLQ